MKVLCIKYQRRQNHSLTKHPPVLYTSSYRQLTPKSIYEEQYMTPQIILMDQKSKTQLIQQKIKQRIQSRKRIQGKQTSSRLNRQASTQQQELCTSNQGESKIRVSLKLRPQTSQKKKHESQHSLTTDSSNKNQIDVNTLIADIFDRGFQLERYLKKNNLNAELYKGKLMENGLFCTLLMSKLAKVEEDKYESIAEKEIVMKLEKLSLIERQEQSCLMIEKKISNLLEERLKTLGKY